MSDIQDTSKGKQRVLEILRKFRQDTLNFDPSKPSNSNIIELDQALDSIEEVLQEEYRHGYNANSRDCECNGKIPHRHIMMDEKSHNIRPDINRGRWESK